MRKKSMLLFFIMQNSRKQRKRRNLGRIGSISEGKEISQRRLEVLRTVGVRSRCAAQRTWVHPSAEYPSHNRFVRWQPEHFRPCPGYGPHKTLWVSWEPDHRASQQQGAQSPHTLNTHSFLPGKRIQRCQQRGQSLSPLEVPPDERSVLQGCLLGWWMRYYKIDPSGEAHKMQERELALKAYGLAFVPLFLEVLQIYHHHKFHRQLAALSAF